MMKTVIASALAASLAVLLLIPVSTHHSFAMYSQKKVVTLTGVVRQFVPQANRAEIHFMLFAPDHKSLAKGPDGKYVEWGSRWRAPRSSSGRVSRRRRSAPARCSAST